MLPIKLLTEKLHRTAKLQSGNTARTKAVHQRTMRHRCKQTDTKAGKQDKEEANTPEGQKSSQDQQQESKNIMDNSYNRTVVPRKDSNLNLEASTAAVFRCHTAEDPQEHPHI